MRIVLKLKCIWSIGGIMKCETVNLFGKIFLSSCHLGDIRMDCLRRNFAQGVFNGCCVIRWALSYVFKKSEVRCPAEHWLSSVSGIWHSCLLSNSPFTARYSDGQGAGCRSCRSVARRTKDLSVLRNVRTSSGAHPASYSVRPEVRAANCLHLLPGLIRVLICQFFLHIHGEVLN